MIVVERFQSSRRVTITATGDATALTRPGPNARLASPGRPETETTELQARREVLKRAQPGQPMLAGFNGVPMPGGCEWIDGDPVQEIKRGRDPHCGAKRVLGRPYCQEHLERSISKTTWREVA